MEGLQDNVMLAINFLPILGIIATFIIAPFARGRSRFFVLALGPLLTMVVSLGPVYVVKDDPALISDLMMFPFMYALAFALCMAYYPVLIAIGLVRYFKKRAQTEHTEPDIE